MREGRMHAAVAALAAAVAIAVAAPGASANGGASLEARAVLPAETFAAGPPSGALIGPGPFNGITPPFASQPVQGISAVLPAGWGRYWLMPDNGYGAKTNSSDFLLRVYRARPHFEWPLGFGSGTVQILDWISLNDADENVPFAITNAAGERHLTGADFDIESMRRPGDGTIWFGEEFGPFLLHTDEDGTLLEAPVPLPGVKSPQNPMLAPGEIANLPASGGFEGMAMSPDGSTLYPMLEKAITTDSDQSRRFIYEFDVASGSYTGDTWQYRMEAPGNAIGDLTQIDRHRMLVIERDSGQGATALFKRIYLVDLRKTDADGYLLKRDLVDLMNIWDPFQISLPARPGDLGLGTWFTFPFLTIESVLPLGNGRLLVINDNNFPFSAGRNPALPDDTELIRLRVPGLLR